MDKRELIEDISSEISMALNLNGKGAKHSG